MWQAADDTCRIRDNDHVLWWYETARLDNLTACFKRWTSSFENCCTQEWNTPFPSWPSFSVCKFKTARICSRDYFVKLDLYQSVGLFTCFCWKGRDAVELFIYTPQVANILELLGGDVTGVPGQTAWIAVSLLVHRQLSGYVSGPESTIPVVPSLTGLYNSDLLCFKC